MRRFFNCLAVAALFAGFAALSSCHDDNDLPDVDIALDVEEGTVVDGMIYVVQGDDIKIGGIKVTNADPCKNAAVTNVAYYWDGLFYAPAPLAPYPMTFSTSETTPAGKHTIGVRCSVLAVDKELAEGLYTFPVRVVEDEDDIPDGTETTTVHAD